MQQNDEEGFLFNPEDISEQEIGLIFELMSGFGGKHVDIETAKECIEVMASKLEFSKESGKSLVEKPDFSNTSHPSSIIDMFLDYLHNMGCPIISADNIARGSLEYIACCEKRKYEFIPHMKSFNSIPKFNTDDKHDISNTYIDEEGRMTNG